MEKMKDYLLSRAKHPFWSAFFISFVLMNSHLIIYSIYEFDRLNFIFFKHQLKGDLDWWLLIPVAVGSINAIFGHSVVTFINTLSYYVNDNSKRLYIKITKGSIKTKKEYDDLDSKHKKNIEALERKLSESNQKNTDDNVYLGIIRNERDELLELKKSLGNTHTKLDVKLNTILKNMKTANIQSSDRSVMVDFLDKSELLINELIEEVQVNHTKI
jgi:hypothetical protein